MNASVTVRILFLPIPLIATHPNNYDKSMPRQISPFFEVAILFGSFEKCHYIN